MTQNKVIDLDIDNYELDDILRLFDIPTNFDEEDMKRGGCIFTGKLVEKDGNIVTGNGPGASQAFAELVTDSL